MIEITSENYREFANKNIYRLIDAGGRKALQKYEGFAGIAIWRTLFGGPFESHELAEDMLAVAEGRMSRDEQEKRARARRRMKKRAQG